MVDVGRLADVLRRGGGVADLVGRFRAVDAERKSLQQTLDGLRAERNEASKKGVDPAERERLRTLSQGIKAGEGRLTDLEAEAQALHMVIPNAPHPSVADGTSAADNPLLSTWGDRPALAFPARPHWEVGEALGILDF